MPLVRRNFAGTARKPRTWRPFSNYFVGAGAVAHAAVAPFIDAPITNPSDASVRLSGTITGGFLDLICDTGVAKSGNSIVYVMLIIPQGMAAPTTFSDAIMSQFEPFVWYHGLLDISPSSDQVGMLRLRIGTKRKFSKGARLLVQAMNQSGAAWAAGSHTWLDGELWIIED